MKEAKFRTFKDGIWYYATLGELTGNVGFDYGVPENVLAFVEGEYKTQWVGLNDKNGREIFEGDIIEIDGHVWTETGIVEFDRGSFIFKQLKDFRQNQTIVCLHDAIRQTWKLEVIGNVWENPELLK